MMSLLNQGRVGKQIFFDSRRCMQKNCSLIVPIPIQTRNSKIPKNIKGIEKIQKKQKFEKQKFLFEMLGLILLLAGLSALADKQKDVFFNVKQLTNSGQHSFPRFR